VAVMPVLIIMLLVRCLPFDRRGRWTDG
jgi:hypothetical protein